MNGLKQNKRRLCSLVLLMCFCLFSFAQHVTVTGKVLDASNEPVIGATVLVKNVSGGGTITDMDGIFRLSVPDEKM